MRDTVTALVSETLTAPHQNGGQNWSAEGSAMSRNRLPWVYLPRLPERPVKDCSIQDFSTNPAVLVLVTGMTKATMFMTSHGAKIQISHRTFTGLVKMSIRKPMADKRIWKNCGKQIGLYRIKNFQAQTERLQVDPDRFSLKRTKTIPSVLISFWTLPSGRQISDQVTEPTEEIVEANPQQKGEKIIRSKIRVLLLKMIFRFVNKTRTDR